MNKTLAAMPRRTPVLAIILAPVALYLLVQLWTNALVPLYRVVWYSDTVLKLRLASDEPAIRIKAAKDAGSWLAEDPAVIDELLLSLKTDESMEVRKASATTLGQLGAQRRLSAEAIDSLSTLVLTEPDNDLLSVAIAAVGQSAAKNRYPDSVSERLVDISREKRPAWAYPRTITALGQIGAAQPLPDTVFVFLNARFTAPERAGEREDIANALTEIAKGRSLPIATLDILAAAFEAEPNHRIRSAILYALAYAAADYPPSVTVLTAATNDPDDNIVSAAENGLRIIEYNRTLANKDPLVVARNTAEPVATRLDALRIIRSTRIDPAAYEQVAALAQDSETDIAVAAMALFPYMARSINGDLEQRVLIPAMSRAMSDADPLIRYAGYAQLSTISRNRPAWLRAADFPAKLDAGVSDPDPKVRVVVMVMLLRDDKRRVAIIERGMADPDPYVRSSAVSWVALPGTKASQRATLITEALNDPDPRVRQSAADAQQSWDTRERAWPIKLWQLWQKGERGQVGLTVLIAVTAATPVLIGWIFLLYFMARLLTYLQQRRWRAAATVPVMATWALASYGMFALYFGAAHMVNPDAGEIAILASVLWGAIVAYTALGWGLHYAVRR